MGTTVILKSIATNAAVRNKINKVKAVFLIIHDDGSVTVDHDLILTKTYKGWVAEMPLTNFPPQETVTASAWKLADWFEKMAAALKDNAFDSINLNSFDCRGMFNETAVHSTED